jgi:ubiquinone/menaquinone biosynthesis C-methylase UbiE
MDDIESRNQNTRASYDAIASDYVEQQVNPLYPNSFETHLLNYFIQQIDAQKTVCDVGCGPGQVAAYLHEQAIPTIGIDLSSAMIEQAHQLHPDIRFQQGDMGALPFADGELAAVTAFYAIIHTPREEVTVVLSELHRVIQRNGYILLSFYLGKKADHRRQWFDKAVSLDFFPFTLPEMKGYLREAGFRPQIVVEHSLTPAIEAPYGFILAQKMRRP